MAGLKMSVRPLGDDSGARWDEFVRANAGTYCHLYGWKGVLEEAYGLRCHFLGIFADGELGALLPVAELPRLPWARRRAMSLPFCNYGGLVARPGVDTAQALAAALEHLAGLGIRHVEFRDVAPGHPEANEVSLHVPLPEDEDSLGRLVGERMRNKIRKARKAGLDVRWGADQEDELYRIYCATMGRLGTPVHARAFFRRILARLGPQADILTVRLGERPLGAMLVLRHQQTWCAPFICLRADHRDLNPGMLMHWEALRAACAAGTSVFDLGRSPRHSGPYRFKLQWGAQEVALHYHCHADGAPRAVSSTAFYRSSAAQRLARIWSALPEPVQNRLGPLVRRWMP